MQTCRAALHFVAFKNFKSKNKTEASANNENVGGWLLTVAS